MKLTTLYDHLPHVLRNHCILVRYIRVWLFAVVCILPPPP